MAKQKTQETSHLALHGVDGRIEPVPEIPRLPHRERFNIAVGASAEPSCAGVVFATKTLRLFGLLPSRSKRHTCVQDSDTPDRSPERFECRHSTLPRLRDNAAPGSAGQRDYSAHRSSPAA